MPTRTGRATDLQDLKQLFTVSVLLEEFDSKTDFMSTDSSSDDGDMSTDSETDSADELLKDESTASQLCELYILGDSFRYHENRMICQKSKEFAEKFFESLPLPYFRQITRMDKVTFWTLVSMIEHHVVFKNRSKFKQIPVSLQLAATLDRLGHHGNGAALKRSGVLWGISTGTIVNCMHRCLIALESALENEVRWPDERERARISSEFAKIGFDGCVGLVDGTTLPLSQRPKIDGETYFDRKKRYSLNMQVICDDRKKILHAYTGNVPQMPNLGPH